jgi:rhodanese-related sulfurtransferase
MRTLIALLPLASFAAAGCASPTGVDAAPAGAPVRSGSAAAAAPTIVDARRARELVAAGVKVVDVRTPAEFEAGHIPGALNIPFEQIERRAAEIGPPSTPVLLYCRSGRRSGIAGEALRQVGFTKQYDLQAYDRWIASEAGATGQ